MAITIKNQMHQVGQEVIDNISRFENNPIVINNNEDYKKIYNDLIIENEKLKKKKKKIWKKNLMKIKR